MLTTKLTLMINHAVRPMLVLTLVLGLMLISAVPTATYAASLTVTTTADELNNDGDCSLREAIRAANLDMQVDACAGRSSVDTIKLKAGTYTLSLAGANEDAAATGDLDIIGNLTIDGAGAGKTIIDGGGIDRVFHVISGKVTLLDMTIQNGNVSTSNNGGGVLNTGGSVRLLKATVTGNSARDGSGLYNAATLTVERSTVTDNGSSFHCGGGVANSGTLTVLKSIVSGNDADECGGGIYSAGGTVMVQESTITNNTVVSGDGGGISGSFASSGTTITIINSTISNNLTSDVGGGGISGGANVTISNSTISGNIAKGVDANGGGGIAVGGNLVMTNSTISGNTTAGHGGGIYNNGGTVRLSFVTITANRADSDQNENGTGGGIFNDTGSVLIKNTILAVNADTTGDGLDCYGTLTSQGYNILRYDNGCDFTGDTATNMIGVDPGLNALGNNGGTTRTHALRSNSPALNAVPTSKCTDNDGNRVRNDQRGIARPQGSACDIGSYEKK